MTNFRHYTGRELASHEADELFEHVLRAKRHTFLVTGITHPRFEELVAEVLSPSQQQRVGEAVRDLLPVLAN